MNKYVNYYRERVPAYPWERQAIGLVCERAGREDVRYALDGLEEKIFVISPPISRSVDSFTLYSEQTGKSPI